MLYIQLGDNCRSKKFFHKKSLILYKKYPSEAVETTDFKYGLRYLMSPEGLPDFNMLDFSFADLRGRDVQRPVKKPVFIWILWDQIERSQTKTVANPCMPENELEWGLWVEYEFDQNRSSSITYPPSDHQTVQINPTLPCFISSSITEL